MNQMFEVRINFGLEEPEFDVSVINRSPRKGFINMEELKKTLTEIFQFMLAEGMDELTQQVMQKQLH